jgi:ABC-2 type transport system ATP-binding protein
VRPTSGGVSLRGRDPRDPQARIDLGYLPERLALPGRMTVRDFLTLHAGLAGLHGADRRHRVTGVMEQVDVIARANERLGHLSKGLRQRVGFAQAFLGRPSLLLLDEPTSGLDPLGVREAREWIHQARSQGSTILVSSHVLSEVERVCDQIAILHEGRLAASGPLDQVVAPGENLEDAFVRWVRG